MLYSASGNPIAGLDSLSGCVVELLALNRVGDLWRVDAAVDGVKLPQPFYEPVGNVVDLDEAALMAYLKEQAIGFADYYRGRSA